MAAGAQTAAEFVSAASCLTPSGPSSLCSDAPSACVAGFGSSAGQIADVSTMMLLKDSLSKEKVVVLVREGKR